MANVTMGMADAFIGQPFVQAYHQFVLPPVVTIVTPAGDVVKESGYTVKHSPGTTIIEVEQSILIAVGGQLRAFLYGPVAVL